MESVDWSKEPGYVLCQLPDGTEVCNAIEYDGRKIPTFENGFVSRMTEIKEKFESRDDDVLIYGYMKSGTHWIWEISKMILNANSEVIEDDTKMNSHLENVSLDELNKLQSPRILSSHLMPSGLPPKIFEKSKVIVPIRHPKDTAVSLFHQQTAETKGTNLRCGWNTFIEHVWFDRDLACYAPWAEFTSEVWSHCQLGNNYKAVIYEHLIDNPNVAIKDIAKFLGRTDISDEQVQDIAAATKFENMKAKKAKTEELFALTFHEGYTMFRKGISGDWKNYFTKEQSDAFDKRMKELVAKDENLRQVMLFYDSEKQTESV